MRNLRPKMRVFYERVPQERIEEFQNLRQSDADRTQRLVNQRFPELLAAREAFLGPEKTLPPKME